MDKLIKVGFTLLLVASIAAPGSFATAKTIEDVPTTESSILSRTADPISISQQRLEQEKAKDSDMKIEESTEKSTEEVNKETEATSNEETEQSSSSEDSTQTTDSSIEKTKKKSPRATVLKVGKYGVDDPSTYDIDHRLSHLLANGMAYGGNAQINPEFTGRNKQIGELTLEDLQTLTYFRVLDGVSIENIQSIKGLEFATNLEFLNLKNMPEVQEIPFDSLPRLKELTLYTFPGIKNEFNITALKELTKLSITDLRNLEVQLDFSHFLDLTDLTIEFVPNESQQINLSKNTKLTNLDLKEYPIKSIDLKYNPDIYFARFISMPLTHINLTGCKKLYQLFISHCSIETLDLREATKLYQLSCMNNYRLHELNLENNLDLDSVYINYNNVGDITSAMGLSKLRNLNYSNQELIVPVKVINGEVEIEKLKTSAGKGLSVTKGTITGNPKIVVSGDKIKLSKITGSSINGKYLNFTYDREQLLEGMSPQNGSTFKKFDGKITLYAIADLKTDLKADKKKIDKGDTVSWTWTVSSFADSSAVDLFPEIDLPTGLTLVPGSVKIANSPVADNAIDGSISMGTLGENETKTITFETTATGNAEEWLEAKGDINWDDGSGFGPYNMESSDKVQIKDDEQTDTPQPTEEMGLLSVPIRFDYGIKDMSNTAQTFSLSPDLYQTNTNVITNGFYTRVKDDRSTSTGWSLTTQLSSFVNVTDTSSGMPDSYGTALRFEDLSIEGVKDRDTPQESIDPGAAGAPNLLKTSEKIVAGDSAKTLVSAQPYEGQGTWQLRIPFDKVFLDLPAYAGKERTNFQAKLTWSLNDTPTP